MDILQAGLVAVAAALPADRAALALACCVVTVAEHEDGRRAEQADAAAARTLAAILAALNAATQARRSQGTVRA
jgi:hypothetical protein